LLESRAGNAAEAAPSVSDGALKLSRAALVEAPFAGHGLYALAEAPAPIASLRDFERDSGIDFRFGLLEERSKSLGLPANVFMDDLLAVLMIAAAVK
jgi:hypothetical protein